MIVPILLAAMFAATPGDELCAQLLTERDRARAEGRIDFTAWIEIEGDVATPGFEAGAPFTVRRITFLGHRAFGDATLRRALTFDEGALLDLDELKASLGRLAAFGAAEAEIRRDDTRGVADIEIAIDEAKPGSWSLSGPAGPPSLFGPLSGSVARRLPVFATWQVALSAPMLAVSVSRMFVPGQEWTSGVAWSPMSSTRGIAAAWGLQQLRARIAPAPMRWDPLIVEVRAPAARAMVCEPRGPRLAWLRMVVGMAVDWGLPAVLF